jgi:hypothetical protein
MSYVCSEPGCGQRFSALRHLQNHVGVIHRGEQRYVCPEPGCNQAYSYRNQLAVHKRVAHSDPSCPFKCMRRGCSAAFATEEDLVAHKKDRHMRNKGRPAPASSQPPGETASRPPPRRQPSTVTAATYPAGHLPFVPTVHPRARQQLSMLHHIAAAPELWQPYGNGGQCFPSYYDYGSSNPLIVLAAQARMLIAPEPQQTPYLVKEEMPTSMPVARTSSAGPSYLDAGEPPGPSRLMAPSNVHIMGTAWNNKQKRASPYAPPATKRGASTSLLTKRGTLISTSQPSERTPKPRPRSAAAKAKAPAESARAPPRQQPSFDVDDVEAAAQLLELGNVFHTPRNQACGHADAAEDDTLAAPPPCLAPVPKAWSRQHCCSAAQAPADDACACAADDC